LDKNPTVKKYLTVQKEGNREVSRNIDHYNLDMIISVGYKVNSIKATKFRQWATSVLKNYIQNGYSINNNKITSQRFENLEYEVIELKNKQIKSDEKFNKLFNVLEDRSIKEQTNGIFFNGEVFDAHSFISDLLRKATKSIVLIDNYISDATLTLFSKIPNIQVTIYTDKQPKQLRLDFTKYNNKRLFVIIKTFKDSHDRFLIINNKEVYHMGASLKDLGKKWFAFSKFDINILNILERLESIK